MNFHLQVVELIFSLIITDVTQVEKLLLPKNMLK
jgi:hypothetical protein